MKDGKHIVTLLESRFLTAFLKGAPEKGVCRKMYSQIFFNLFARFD